MYAPASTNLTPNAAQSMYEMDSSMDDEFFAPVMQVLRLKKLNDSHGHGHGHGHGEGEKWAVALSDGEHFLHGECAPEPLNKMIHHHLIAQNAIIKVKQFFMSNRGDRKVCYILDAQQAAPTPDKYFGSPIDIRLFIHDLKFNPQGEIIKSTRQRRGMMVEPTTAPGNQGQKEGSKDGFFATRPEPNWQNAYRDVHHRQTVLEKIESVLEGAEKIQHRTISSHRKGEISILAKQWELKLYQQADSFEAYIDESSFMKRMNELGRSANREREITLMQHHRLHLLRHAMMCRDAVCTVSPFCRDMKNVVKHMERCKEGQRCQVPFCVTLQNLMHHSKCCREPECKICNPSIRLPGCLLCEEEGKKHQQNRAIIQSQSSVPAKLRQDYLLTMLHASTCQHDEDEQCLISPLCFDLKKLWIHKTYCTDLSCQYPFCASSRSILNHYNSCCNDTCQVCPPVRATKAKHGADKLTVPVGLQVNNPVTGVQPVKSLSAIRPVQEAQPVMPPSASNPPQEPQVTVACLSADVNMVAQQVAIYKEIKQKQNRKRSLASSTSQNPARDSFDAYMAGAPLCDIDSIMEDLSIQSSAYGGSISSDSLSRTSANLVTDDPQVREYERLARAHQQRQQSGSSGNSNSSASSKIHGKPASTSLCEEDKKLPAESGSSKKFTRVEHNYLGTTYPTENNSKKVKCKHCHIGVFVPPIASQIFCQDCTSISFIGGSQTASRRRINAEV